MSKFDEPSQASVRRSMDMDRSLYLFLNKFRIKRFDRMDFEAKYTKKSDNSSRISPRAGILADHNISGEI